MAELREAIEAAFEEVEKQEPAPVIEVAAKEVPEVKEPEQLKLELEEPKAKEPVEEAKVEEVKEAEEHKEPEAKVLPTDRAPQSWKPAEKAKWATIDPTVRQEILRRDREITKTLSETAETRQLATQFQQVVQPYMARFTSMNAHPLAAIQELLKADHLLSNAPKTQRAQLMAKLIGDYDVDIQALDDALSGRAQVDPVESKVEALLKQRLGPLEQQLSRFQQMEAQREQHSAREVEQSLASFENNEKYPYFEQVRGEMADIIELSAKRNVYVSLEQAYNKAIQLDPLISQELASKSAEAKAAQANASAQRALKASSSVRGTPSGVVPGAPNVNDRRAVIEAAFESLGGR